ncbi:unnamed protein product [Boreogadus saida]
MASGPHPGVRGQDSPTPGGDVVGEEGRGSLVSVQSDQILWSNSDQILWSNSDQNLWSNSDQNLWSNSDQNL